ncbi:MAG: hypothetical protein JWM38_1227 [Sphingomonas bacterium]|jgi:hypothetical protein|nr:hypothetical protein [Sphingomonas bacterium]MDB5684491.1 hypothetical protein [Sphingomonas bacterium]MDB5717800.1 hypothetical protein [Sphingomonas bacterium]
MASSTAMVPTESGSKYLQQVCKHWSHKLEVSFTPEAGTVTFPASKATMTAHAETLEVQVDADDDETLQRMKGVVANHIDRFAFREAPLTYDWKDAA